MMPMTLQQLTIECLKQMDAGNGNKIVLVAKDTEHNSFTPIWCTFDDNIDTINELVITKYPDKMILLG